MSALSLSVTEALWRRELTRYLRDPSQIFGGLSRTVLWLIILGFGLGATLREIEGYSYAQYVLPGVALLNVLFASLQSGFQLVYDRQHGLLRQILISPAPSLSVTLGKILGGATVAVAQGLIPIAFAPVVGVQISLLALAGAMAVLFAMGVGLTGLGVLIALRRGSIDNFGSISNGVIQPLYFLSGSIFPLKGIVGGIGFLDIPPALRDQLRMHGINAIGGGWVVELPGWLDMLVRLNPMTYSLDLLRWCLLDFHQLQLATNLAVTAGFGLVTTVLAIRALDRARQR
ncbi:ABC transporter permease [Paracoccus tibetensis]|uniref:Transport permease protein n=1 Tax=Paracoccus tibetensis TaxID=336292 RepID=A0A1G5C5E9_9RHOB|nr:ABC transporter permease [Paracoccus tibetensis]SCX97547.1 ABC-2 type transport system permease protein [Paracoccus tibetensis]